MENNIISLITLIIVLAASIQWFSWRVKIPAIILLLISGIILGPVLSYINPDKLLGNFLHPFISLSVAIIIFEGSLTLKFKDILGLGNVIRNLITFGMLITFIITALFTEIITGVTWETAFLFGAITVVSGPTVIIPLLRVVKPKPAISRILKWEGILIDPLGVILSVIVYEIIISKASNSLITAGLIFFKIFLIGILLGVGFGYIYGLFLKRHWIPEFLQNISTLAVVLGLFTLSNIFQNEAGLLTVTVFGIILANMEDVNIEDIINFKESLSILLTSLLFIFLSARFDLQSFKKLGLKAVFVFLIIQFLARPVNVFFSTLKSDLSIGEKALISWIAPRGIVAAAMASFFAINLERQGFSNANILVSLTFMVIIGTIVLQSITSRPFAKVLKCAEDEVKGVFIVGANIVARAVGDALRNNGYEILLADTSWEYISDARLEGFETYLGNPISEHATRHLDLVEYSKVFAMTPFEHVNLTNIMHFGKEFGKNNVFMIKSKPAEELPERMILQYKHYGNLLFGKNITYGYLKSLIKDGAEIHTTTLTDEFNYEKFLNLHKNNELVLLFAVNEAGKLHICSDDRKIEPEAGWKIIYLKSGE